ncbi:radical SAM protein [Desulfitobacterium chlororespirans]|uniref:Biotin synthase n=1 Tax=Desulfitobacterium chlororespirans DSM 11544 TaxID=1121395 RepID=A0A1M7SHS5_9FIRM|nr:radical SAM protein [Desulfitobacterium chlororespirans]SHN58056.1 biotin synthase [Desulfitobacterium chlororespirans DSM 11544]
MKQKLGEIIKKALEGGEITAEELKELLMVPSLAEEAYLLCAASRKMVERASQSKAEVHGQVGIDCGPCPKNCAFCSFAARNQVFPEAIVRTAEDIVSRCLSLEKEGANAIFLMATARYAFADYLKIAREVKRELKPETPLIANIDDFGDEEAQALKKTGFQGIYHVMHMGEGRETEIEPRIRLKTITAALKAGLEIGTAVEPIGPEHSLDEIIEKTMLIRAMKPAHAGVGRRIKIPGSSLAVHGQFNAAQIASVQAAVILALGYEVKGHCGEHGIGAMAGVNLAFAEAGSNPRDTEVNTVKGDNVGIRRAELREAGWEIHEGPSVIFQQ